MNPLKVLRRACQSSLHILLTYFIGQPTIRLVSGREITGQVLQKLLLRASVQCKRMRIKINDLTANSYENCFLGKFKQCSIL